MKNWKTMMAGILSIVGGITRGIFAFKNNNFSEEAITTSVTMVLTGVGLMFAKDFNVTGGTTAATPEAQKIIDGKQ